MKCPCCHSTKTKEDFYWRGDWLAYKECKTCVKEIRDKKKHYPTSKGIFSLEGGNWLKIIIG